VQLSVALMQKMLCNIVHKFLLQKILIAYQYSETNVMHFLFNLLRIKGLHMFRALLAHLQATQTGLGILRVCCQLAAPDISIVKPTCCTFIQFIEN
jgi:hypothetical protein